nr:hypothetical protein [Tanacetum cinerariifolium]
GTILLIELTTVEIRNSKAYKEYHGYAMGEAVPKLKASARKKKGDSASSTTPHTPTPTTTVESAPRLSATAKEKQPSRATTPLTKDDEEDKETGKGGDEVRESEGESDEEETREEEDENFDPIPRTPDESEEESNDEEEQDLRLSEEARIQEEEDTDELYCEAPIPPPTIPSIILENLPTFNSAFRFDERLRLLETSFSEYRQTNQFADAVSAIPGIVHQYMDQKIKEAVQEAVQIQTGSKTHCNERMTNFFATLMKI